MKTFVAGDYRQQTGDSHGLLASKIGNRAPRRIDLLPMQTRTTHTYTTDFETLGALVLGIHLDITAITGVGGLQVGAQTKAPEGGYSYHIAQADLAVNPEAFLMTVGPYCSVPANTNYATDSFCMMLPPEMRLVVWMTATSVTYSLHVYLL